MTRRRSKVVAAIAAGAVAGGGIAVGAVAATGGGGPDASGDLASAINQRAGTSLTAEQVRAAYLDVLRERLAAAVTAGRLTQEQADAMVARAQAGRLPIEPLRGRGGPGHGPRAEILAPVATLLRLSEDELRTQLGSGRTLTQIAAAQNVGKAELVAAIAKAITDSGAPGLTEAQVTQLATRIADGTERLGRGPGGPGHGPRAEILAPVATLLRQSEEQLRTQLRSGRTLTQIAATQNVGKADLVAAIKTAIADSGRMGLTDAELTQLATRIADGTGPGPGRGRGPGGPGGFPGP